MQHLMPRLYDYLSLSKRHRDPDEERVTVTQVNSLLLVFLDGDTSSGPPLVSAGSSRWLSEDDRSLESRAGCKRLSGLALLCVLLVFISLCLSVLDLKICPGGLREHLDNRCGDLETISHQTTPCRHTRENTVLRLLGECCDVLTGC